MRVSSLLLGVCFFLFKEPCRVCIFFHCTLLPGDIYPRAPRRGAGPGDGPTGEAVCVRALLFTVAE